MNSKIEQVIEEIEAYITNCKPQTLNHANIVVNREQLEELLTELRMKTPEEIKQYQKIIRNKDAILADAQTKAEGIIAEAKVTTDQLVSEHQIMQQAYAEANRVVLAATKQGQEILNHATNDANDIRMGAMQYTDDLLKNVEDIIRHSMKETQSRAEGLLGSLKSCYDIVTANRSQLVPAEEPAQPVPQQETETSAEAESATEAEK